MRPNIRLSAVITALLLASAPAGALVQSATTSSASSAGTTAAASAEAVTASVASASIADAASASTTVAAAEASATDAVAADQSADSSANDHINDADDAGSTEVATVQRSCGAEADPHYDPPSGQGLAECQDEDGNFDPTREYTAKHFTNEVTCGTEDLVVPDSSVLNVSGDGGADPGSQSGGGYLQVCSDKDLPVHGRITLAGEGSTSGFAGSVTADGDNDNEFEGNDQATGWAQVNVDTSGSAPSIRCGKAYADGGRADASNPTDEDTEEQCG